MTLDHAIKMLKALKEQHGGTIEVFFDCPKCGLSYQPHTVVASAVHIASKPEPESPPR